MNELRSTGAEILAVDVGGLTEKRVSPASSDKLEIHVESLDTMEYDAINVVDFDIEQLQRLAYRPGRLAFVSANLNHPELLSTPAKRWVVTERGGKKIGITGVFLPEHEAFSNATLALEEVLGELRDVVDVMVVLAYGPQVQVGELVQKYPDIDIAVSNSHSVPDSEISWIGDNQALLAPVSKGTWLVGLDVDMARGVDVSTTKSIKVDLGDSIADDKSIRELIDQRTREQYQARNLKVTTDVGETFLNLSPEEFMRQKAGGIQ